MRGPNKQWIDLPKDQKEAFRILQSFMGPVISAYEGWLWDQAVREEAAAKAKGKKNFVPDLPENLLKKYKAVKDYAEFAGKKMTLVVEE